MPGRRGKCGPCGASLLWAKMHSGAANPLNPQEIPLDQVEVKLGIIAYNPRTGGGRAVSAATIACVPAWAAAGATFHLSHWATCSERLAVRAAIGANRVKTDG